jgi:hypothetical protein
MENNNSGSRFMKTANSAIMWILVVITGLLAWQTRRLTRDIAALSAPATEATVHAETSAPIVATPAPADSEFKAVPAPPVPSKKPAVATSAKRNYTQPVKELPAPPVALPTSAPMGKVVPTDVTPAEPLPFPRTEAQVPVKPAKISATIASGTILTVRLLDTLNTDRNQPGDRFRASLEDPIMLDGNVVLPRGTTVEGRIVDAQQAGRVKGVAQIAVELSQVQLAGGNTIVIDTDTVRREGETSTGSDTAKVGTGAAIGAVIGAIGGGGKGAAIGAATGAGAGTAGVLLTRGKPLILSQETILSFQLNAPVTLEVVPGQASDVSLTQPQHVVPSPRDWNRDRPILRRRRLG